MVSDGPAEVLYDRRSEREVLERLFAGVRGGQSRVLVITGEPGVGKTALLESAMESLEMVCGPRRVRHGC
jgi:predicted ATPase